MNEEQFNIRQIQRALRILHKNNEDIPVVSEDGIFGEETEKAVIAFQLQNNLSATGVVDYETWVLLMQKANEYIRKNAEPFPIFPYVSDEKSAVFPNEEGMAILFVQAMIKFISKQYSGFDEVELTGKNDEATRNAIIFITELDGEGKTDGSLTKRTWNAVARLFNAVI